MAIDKQSATRSVSLAVIIGLLVICIGLGTMMFITIDAASAARDDNARKLLARLSWMSLALLCLAMLMTIWVILRHIRNRMRNSAPPPREPMPYVNAWELAGQRFQLNEDTEPEDPDYLADDDEEGGDEDESGSQGPRDRWR